MAHEKLIEWLQGLAAVVAMKVQHESGQPCSVVISVLTESLILGGSNANTDGVRLVLTESLEQIAPTKPGDATLQ
jgi:hypothetical protein